MENTYENDPSEWHFARLMEQYYGGYLFQYRYTQIQWTPEHKDFLNIPSLRVEVMNPDFGVETYTFNYRGDILDFRYRLVKDGSFRVVAFQYEYDVEGNLIEEIIFRLDRNLLPHLDFLLRVVSFGQEFIMKSSRY